MLLSFVIPVYNEQDSLKQLTDEIIANCAPHNYEIIFIDDGSQDHSFAIMEELACQDPNIKVVKFRRNFGKAAALQYGFNLAQGEIVFTLDADLQDNPKEIPKFLDKIAEGWDLVSGWKQKEMTLA